MLICLQKSCRLADYLRKTVLACDVGSNIVGSVCILNKHHPVSRSGYTSLESYVSRFVYYLAGIVSG